MAQRQFGPVLQQIRRLITRPTTEALADGGLLERFAVNQEEAAFETLVQRHGPLVRGVCRRLLHDEHEAEDAFQATFLVLARKAPAIRKRHSVASWLYGVAYRVATKARVRADRRRACALPGPDVATAPTMDTAMRELRQVIDEELSHLPEKYRAPLVLCYLEGKTKDEAALDLGWPSGTVSGRLARARDILRERLTRRGLAFSTGLFVTLMTESTAPAAVPPALVVAAMQAATEQVLPATVPGGVAELTHEVLRDLAVAKLKFAWKLTAALVLVGLTAGVLCGQAFKTSSPVGPVAPEVGELAKPAADLPRTFDSTLALVVWQRLADGTNVPLGNTPSQDRRGVHIPAGSDWFVAALSDGMNGFGGGFGGFGFPGGGMGSMPFGAPAGKPTEKELQDLAAEINKLAIPGLALENREYSDADLAHFKELDLRFLSVRRTKVTDVGLKELRGISGLRTLVLEGDALTGMGLTHLRGMKSLRALELSGTAITNESITHLKDLPDLKELVLKQTAVSGEGLKALGELPSMKRLETLHLNGDAITDDGMSHLAGLTGLRRLHLCATEVGDTGLIAIGKLASLESFSHTSQEAGSFNLLNPNIAAAEVTDEGLKALGMLKAVRELTIEGNFSDAGLTHLEGLTALRRLRLVGENLTDAGLANLVGLTQLETLEMGAGTFAEAKGIAALKRLPRLKTLALPPTVLPETVAEIRRALGDGITVTSFRLPGFSFGGGGGAPFGGPGQALPQFPKGGAPQPPFELPAGK